MASRFLYTEYKKMWGEKEIEFDQVGLACIELVIVSRVGMQLEVGGWKLEVVPYYRKFLKGFKS